MDKLELYDIIRGRRLTENYIRNTDPSGFAVLLSIWQVEAEAMEWARTAYNDQHYKL